MLIQLTWILGICATLVVFLLVARFLKDNSRKESDRWPTYAKKLLSEREQVLYWRLVAAFPEHVVLAQVALSQLLGVERKAANRQAVSNRFRQLCADFVICKRTFEPVAVIELDGASHDHPRRQEADVRKAAALTSAGIQLVRVNVASIPNEIDLQQLLSGRAADELERSSLSPSAS